MASLWAEGQASTPTPSLLQRPDNSLTTRKPRTGVQPSGSYQSRLDDRQNPAVLFQLPPRHARSPPPRSVPPSVPGGSFAASLEYSP